MKKLLLAVGFMVFAAACGETEPVRVTGAGGGAAAAGGGTAAAGGGTAAAGGGMAAAGGGGAAAAPSFATIYSSIISQRCSPCHTTPTGIGVTQGHLDMTSEPTAFSSLVNAPTAGIACGGVGTRVVPGNPGASIMFLKIDLTDPAPCGAKMPFGLPPLSQGEVDMIGAWITAGALNNQ